MSRLYSLYVQLLVWKNKHIQINILDSFDKKAFLNLFLKIKFTIRNLLYK